MNFKLKKFTRYYKPYKKIFFLDMFFSILNALIMLTVPLIIRYVINNISNQESNETKKMLLIFVVIILILFGLLYCCNYFTIYYGHLMGAKMEKDMRREIFNHCQKLSFSFYDNEKVGNLMSRITVDLNNISEFLHHLPEDVTMISLKIIGSLIVFSYINKKLTFITFGIIFLILIIAMFKLPKINKAFLDNHEKISEINSQIEDSLAGIKTVKSFSNENLEINKFKNVNENFVESKKFSFKLIAGFFSGAVVLIIGLIPIVTSFSIFFILNNTMSINDLMTFILYVDVIIDPIFSLISRTDQYQDAIAGYERFLEILRIKPEIINSENSVKLKNTLGNICFNNVNFKYRKNGNYVFKNLNLNIKSGEDVALVGSSGIGKSTLCNLIPRFYDILKGEITIDNINIKNIEISNLRKNIGFVQQDNYLFSGTILENIKYGKLDSDDNEIIEAAKKAYAHEFIMNFPDGYKTEIGQNGLKLSGGQKQRLSIARVFLKNPPILIFDEATSALDNESEKYIQRSMEILSKDRTTIIIAHRLSTIKNANRILVLDNRKIVEQGTHQELIEKKGTYWEFYNLQF